MTGSLRVLKGQKPLPASSPEALTRTPPAPSWLGESARDAWRDVAPGLVKLGVLTPVDLPGLAIYCCCVGNWRDAQEALAREGLTITTPGGLVAPHPLVTIARGWALQARGWASLYGLTPLARRRLGL